ncbi:MAG: hypothetical protein ABR583_08945 [Gaiellaceae bacterium]
MRALAIDLDVFGDTRALWAGWLEDAARRFAAIAPLDPAALPADRVQAAAALDAWAAAGIGDWRAALGRWAEDHAPLHLRRKADVGDLLRRAQAHGARVGVFTDAPEPLARVVLAQLGAERRVDALETGAGALERLLARLGPHAVVVHSREDLLRSGD